MELTKDELLKMFDEGSRYILRPDATLTFTNFCNLLPKKKDKIQSELDIEEPKERTKNNKIDGIIFGFSAKRRLKNYVISAAINGNLDGKNSMFATFTFPNSEVIKEYNKKEHDEILTKAMYSYLNNLKVNYGLKEYVVVSERHDGKRAKLNQKGKATKIGWLHFHTILVFDKFIDVKLLNYLWLKRINHDKNLLCNFASKDSLDRIINLVEASDKRLLDNNFNNPRYYPIDWHRVDCFPDNYLANLVKSIKNNCLKDANENAFKTLGLYDINTLSSFLYNPVDVEFFACDSNGLKSTNYKTLRKVVSYITTYISKSNNSMRKEYFDGNCYEVEEKIYSRIWSATRLFTKQIHKKLIDKNFAESLLNREFVKCIETKKDIVNTKTGEVNTAIFYTIILNYDVYKQRRYLNEFKVIDS